MSKSVSLLSALLCTFIWGTTFIAQDTGMDDIGPFTFNAVRFFIGFLAILPVALLFETKKFKIEFKIGYRYFVILSCFIGLSLFLGSALQQIALISKEWCTTRHQQDMFGFLKKISVEKLQNIVIWVIIHDLIIVEVSFLKSLIVIWQKNRIFFQNTKICFFHVLLDIWAKLGSSMYSLYSSLSRLNIASVDLFNSLKAFGEF